MSLPSHRPGPSSSRKGHRSYSHCSTVSGESQLSGYQRAESIRSKRSSTPRWLGSIKNWLSVSEPSAQAMRTQKKTAYKKYGIDLNDPQAAAKMHLPIGKVPDGVTTSSRGPIPEKALRERTKEHTAGLSYPDRGDTGSILSGSSSAASVRITKEIAPWA
ncbi:hypothetical protein HIM_03956 [Hirsutella minnesotensis 3608]|uniref:Uncharacterized protein n=1 Tax=Hirsutella minnesotensis 3608 TaxID=1043627 RepID=A0A0F7ZQ47_9HYPO|nr:hypothetical protein HIM_03956 [Hirsutella minnesotensis 3608]